MTMIPCVQVSVPSVYHAPSPSRVRSKDADVCLLSRKSPRQPAISKTGGTPTTHNNKVRTGTPRTRLHAGHGRAHPGHYSPRRARHKGHQHHRVAPPAQQDQEQHATHLSGAALREVTLKGIRVDSRVPVRHGPRARRGVGETAERIRFASRVSARS